MQPIHKLTQATRGSASGRAAFGESWPDSIIDASNRKPGPNRSIDLFRFAVVDFVEQRHAVGLGPQSHLSGVAEGGVFDLEQLLAVVKHPEAVAFEIDTEGKPLIGWDRYVDAVATRPTDNVKRAANTADGLIEHDVVLKCVGADHVVIVRISGPPDEAGRPVLGTGNGLELHLDEAVLNVGVVLEKQRISSRPDCLTTFNFEGAVWSCSIVHFGLPLPVLVAIQPLGVAPTASVSKLAVLSAMAVASIKQSSVAAVRIPFIGFPCVLPRSHQRQGDAVDRLAHRGSLFIISEG